MILRVLLLGFILYMVFRFVSRFLLPFFQMTKMASDRMQQMRKQMEDMHNQATGNVNPTAANPQAHSAQPRQVDGDYIDYEEVK